MSATDLAAEVAACDPTLQIVWQGQHAPRAGATAVLHALK